MQQAALVLLAVASLLYSQVSGETKQKVKSVTTLIDAKWEVTPITLEVAEYLADEDPDYLWSFMDLVSSMQPQLVELGSDRERYDAVLRHASRLLSPAQVSVLKLGLSLHVDSPKVEMFMQMAKERGVPATHCPAAVDVQGQLSCSAEELVRLVRQGPGGRAPELFAVDHHFPGSRNCSVVAVLYGELGTPEFSRLHSALKELASAGSMHYVVRHYVRERPARRVRLSGYGVELQIKSTEYKAQDDTRVKGDGQSDGPDPLEEEEVEGFHFSRLRVLYPDEAEGLDALRQHLLESSNDMAPLKVWQVQDLSLQAAARVMASPREEALKVLANIAQNFPLQAKSLARTAVSDELKEEVKQNQEGFAASLNLQPTDTALFLNGMFFDLDLVDSFSLLEAVRQELRLVEGLHRVGVSEPLTKELLSLDVASSSGQRDYGLDIRDSAVFWVNDIEQDKKYRRWSESLLDLLRPTFPGMLRSIRRNLYNLVVIADPSKKEARPLLKMAESFYVHTAPLRVGVVFALTADETASGLSDPGVALLNAFNYAAEQKDPYGGLSFLTDVYAAVKDERDLTVEDVKTQLLKTYPSADVEDILGEDSEYNTGRRLAREFLDRSGLRRFPQVLLNGIPLPEKSLNADDFEEAVLSEIMSQTPVFQKAVYKGDLSDRDNTLDFIMDQPNVMPRLNERVLAQDKSQLLDLGRAEDPASPRSTAALLARLRYFSDAKRRDAEDEGLVLTHWVVGDMRAAPGRRLLREALRQMLSSGQSRVSVVFNPEPGHGEGPDLNKLVLAALEALSPLQASQYIIKVFADDELAGAIASGEKAPGDVVIPGLDAAALARAWEAAGGSEEPARHREWCSRVLRLAPGQRAVVSNGRLLGPLEPQEDFTGDDFALLDKYNMNSYGDKLLKVVGNLPPDEDRVTSDMLMRTVALLMYRPQTRSRFKIPFKTDEHSVLKLPARSPAEAAFDVTVIVDPVSRGAQKVVPIVTVLQEVVNCNLRVFLNCVEKHSDMPLKSFYRFVLEPELQFGADGRLGPGPVARFANMPASPLFTQNMHVPENWLVESVRSPYDLDNIKLEDVDSTVHSEFELEYLLLEGHCFEASVGNPPRGLQITLGTESQPVQVDTIVMANLGYFQLKANPGAWLLRLRQGRSADIYDIVSHEGADVPANSSDIKVVISSFRSHVMKLKVSKKPDKMHLDLLSEEEDRTGLWNSITSTFGASKKAEEEAEDKINIFSVASGHLYERFLRIMMLSVLKHTRTPVKFWFLKNYLSPTFKDFLPFMAEEYQFEYELVQYKWPRWLHQQTEKQRIIWGYKILFLDVLFPLDVRKIIFVDADQVVRADMKELVDLDLGGAPYAYTPFCDSRAEMDGFRFWRHGYWRNHLQGRRYHISALYVVDLRRFRRVAAGDRLRGQYQALSQDPNSLSNLDQDLPNNMIHQVALKSLPQEWLWCETWCDDASKPLAKTIDLCNNPLTKEAKLTAAMRIVEEWKDYDAEIKRLQAKIDDLHSEDLQHSPHALPGDHRPHSEL
ncbi:UDP-glucose:glycoprotein glucosyltransferase isoform X2 [Bacillus rossius redtenbacheri]